MSRSALRFPRSTRIRSVDKDYDGSGWNGWWYESGREGTGISLEIQDNTLFLAWYSYDDQGRPIWYTANGRIASNNFSGSMYEWKGWTLGTQYSQPTPKAVGTASILFTGPDKAVISWTLGQKQGEKSITRFMDDIAPGAVDTRDITGWWYDPNYNGMGFFVEAQGDTIFIAWYHYGEDTTCRWWSSGGGFSATDTEFSGKLMEWTNGQEMGETYQKPDFTAKHDVSITFLGNGAAGPGVGRHNLQSSTIQLWSHAIEDAYHLPMASLGDANVVTQAAAGLISKFKMQCIQDAN